MRSNVMNDAIIESCLGRTWGVDVNRWGIAFGGAEKVWSISFRKGERIDDGAVRFGIVVSERAAAAGIKTVVMERLDGSVSFRRRLMRTQEVLAEFLRRAGVEVVFVSAAHTSDTCPYCGSRLIQGGRWAVKYCPLCDRAMNRDWVAVRNLVLNWCGGRGGRI
ncbi:MAG: zinc ribbon domain-containing protein [Thermofilum sp.]